MSNGMNLFKYIFIGSLIFFVSSCGVLRKGSGTDYRKEPLSDEDEKKVMFYFLNGNKEKLIGNNSGAIGYFSKVIEIDKYNDASYYEIARLLDTEGRGLTALDYAKKALQLDSENIWYRTLVAQLYQKFGYHKEAVKELEYILELYPERVEHYFELATAYIYIGDFRSAAKVYQRLEDQVGVYEDLSVQKQQIYTSLGEYDKAVREIEKLIESDPSEVRYYGMLAEVYQSQKKYDKAIKAYEKILEIEPDNGTVRLSLFEYYMETGDQPKAEEQIMMAFSSKHVDIDTKVQILLGYYNMTEKDEKLKGQVYKLLEVLVETHPSQAKTYAIYGDFLYRDEKYVEARDMFRKSTEFDKNRFPVWNQIMLASIYLNDFENLIEDSEKAMEYFPLQPSIYLFNGMAHLRLRNLDEAIEVLNSGKDLVVGNKELEKEFYSHLGEAYYRAERFEESDKFFDKALKISPDDAFILNNYSYYLSVRGDKLEKAKTMSFRSNEIIPNQASFQDTYGWILYKLGEYQEAKKWIGKSLENSPNSGVVLEHYGDVLYRLGDNEGAMEYWKRAKETGDDDLTEFIDKKISDGKLYE
jgi:tetratricopeptide (TPR) repeat protein